MTLPRVAVVITEFGIPSEVWALRQAETFRAVTPVYVAARRRPGGLDLPPGRELHLYDPDGDGRAPPFRRIQRKLGLPSGALPPPAVLTRLRATIAEARVEAALVHFAWEAMAVRAACPDLPIVAHVHGRDVSQLLEGPAYRRALVRALPTLQRVIAVGRHQARLLDRLVPGTGARLIPCGAPMADFARRPLPERGPGDPVVFATVGRISPEKGQIETVAAFERVVADGPDARLVIVGDGPGMADLRARVAASPAADRIRLTGFLPPAAIADELSSAHVFLQHSRPAGGWVEGFGVTLAEAAAAGLPLLGSNQGGIPDQIEEDVNGHLFAEGDVRAQAHLMAALAADEPRRREMGAAARRIATERFDSAILAPRLEAEILAVLAETGQGPVGDPGGGTPAETIP